ncbi:MAG: SAM-dependent methyltransferase [Jatrophihabitans sp.]|uniref:SAM-dependent methyltransferase n=1 Tax=Jatrophihabitans sp. TaxID=1932789 RepID=UPI003F7D5801
MSSVTGAEHAPAAHYDHVHAAWRLIMGEEFHYGYFRTPEVPLEEATAALTGLMLDRARVGRGDRVLDVGCGTGRQSCDLAADHGADVLGITTSVEGVAAATALAAERGLTTARFEQRDGTATGLPDGSFDVVWALESSHLMRDRAALLGECARLLDSGGRVVLCDITRQREIPFAEVRRRRADFATLNTAFGDAHMEPLALYAERFTALGLEVADATDITTETLPTFAAWRANVERHEDELRTLLDAADLDAFVRSTEILEAFWRDGTLGYGIICAVKR